MSDVVGLILFDFDYKLNKRGELGFCLDGR